ncbi:hypothetical protein C2S51_035320 [Perilla frutescens var. frutescens]|nr:hypothetical protein C2S51_035320 [Perilla frutescens var. frutescens]
MSDYRESALNGAAILNRYRVLSEKAERSLARRNSHAAEIAKREEEIRNLKEELDDECYRGKKLDEQIDRMLEDLRCTGQVLITDQREVQLLEKLWDNEGFRPRIYCQSPNITNALRVRGFRVNNFP